jgi:hypothetical protein
MALTTGLSVQTTIGGRLLEAWHIKGDGSTTTFNPRLACVDHVWIQSITGATYATRTTISSGVITLVQHNGSGLENGKWYYLFLIGSS